MSFAETLGLFAEKGGFVMWVLAALSLYTVAAVLVKLYQFRQARLFGNPIAEEVLMLLEAEEPVKAKRHAKSDPTPMGGVLYHVMHTIQNEKMTPSKRHAEIQRVGGATLKMLESQLRGLELAANIGPLLGLLGTVTGMVKAFSVLQVAGARVDPAALAGGIWEALLTTIAGLAVAVIATVGYYVLDGMVERFRAEMKDAVTRVVEFDSLIADAEQTGNQRKVAAVASAVTRGHREHSAGVSQPAPRVAARARTTVPTV